GGTCGGLDAVRAAAQSGPRRPPDPRVARSPDQCGPGGAPVMPGRTRTRTPGARAKPITSTVRTGRTRGQHGAIQPPGSTYAADAVATMSPAQNSAAARSSARSLSPDDSR